MTAAELDLMDPHIRAMVAKDHIPSERWTHGSAGSRLVGVECQMCRAPWRCPTRLALDALVGPEVARCTCTLWTASIPPMPDSDGTCPKRPVPGVVHPEREP